MANRSTDPHSAPFPTTSLPSQLAATTPQIYLVYCHLVGAGFRVDAVRIGFKAKAYYILASKVGLPPRALRDEVEKLRADPLPPPPSLSVSVLSF